MMVALSTTSCSPNSWLNSISCRCNNDKAPFWQSGPRFGRHQSRIRFSSCWRWARPSLPPGHGRSSAEKCDDSDSGIQMNAQGNTAIISACFVGLFTGISVVLFNAAVRHRFSIFFFSSYPPNIHIITDISFG